MQSHIFNRAKTKKTSETWSDYASCWTTVFCVAARMWTCIWFYFSLLTVKDWLWRISLSKGLSNNYKKYCCLQLNVTLSTACSPQHTFPPQKQILDSWTSAAFLHASSPKCGTLFQTFIRVQLLHWQKTIWKQWFHLREYNPSLQMSSQPLVG